MPVYSLTTHPRRVTRTNRKSGPRAARTAARQGFTLVEMMVAVMMLSVGLLGLASSSAHVVRQVGGGAQQTIAANVIQSRVEWLRSVPCSKITDSTAVTRRVREHWTPGPTVNGVLWVRDTVMYSVGSTQRTKVYTMAVQC